MSKPNLTGPVAAALQAGDWFAPKGDPYAYRPVNGGEAFEFIDQRTGKSGTFSKEWLMEQDPERAAAWLNASGFASAKGNGPGATPRDEPAPQPASQPAAQDDLPTDPVARMRAIGGYVEPGAAGWASPAAAPAPAPAPSAPAYQGGFQMPMEGLAERLGLAPGGPAPAPAPEPRQVPQIAPQLATEAAPPAQQFAPLGPAPSAREDYASMTGDDYLGGAAALGQVAATSAAGGAGLYGMYRGGQALYNTLRGPVALPEERWLGDSRMTPGGGVRVGGTPVQSPSRPIAGQLSERAASTLAPQLSDAPQAHYPPDPTPARPAPASRAGVVFTGEGMDAAEAARVAAAEGAPEGAKVAGAQVVKGKGGKFNVIDNAGNVIKSGLTKSRANVLLKSLGAAPTGWLDFVPTHVLQAILEGTSAGSYMGGSPDPRQVY